MEAVKDGVIVGATLLRSVLLENQGLTAYDIWVVNHIYASTDVLQTNDLVMDAVSFRTQDQVEDAELIGFDEFMITEGLIFTSALMIDLDTSGGGVLLGNNWMAVPKPYRVPYLAWVVNGATAVSLNLGVEVYFERVQVSAREKAYLVARAGGKAQTS